MSSTLEADRKPVYLRVADELERKMTGRSAATTVPSEHELARSYEVSRLTARAALEELERRFLVRRSQGRRALVAQRIEYRIGPADPPSWTRSVLLGGGEPRSETLALRRRVPPAAVIRELRILSGAKAMFLARRRYVNGEPAAYAETWLAEDLVPNLHVAIAGEQSLYTAFESIYRLEPVRAATRAEFVVAGAEVARKMGVDGRPMTFCLCGQTNSARYGRRIETTTSWLRADIFRVVFEQDHA
jgi:DNA-binding GntR family transcriptional regulator